MCSGIILIAGSLFILSEAVPRLVRPVHSNAGGMIIFDGLSKPEEERIKAAARKLLLTFGIVHSTIEIEHPGQECEPDELRRRLSKAWSRILTYPESTRRPLLRDYAVRFSCPVYFSGFLSNSALHPSAQK